MKPSNNRRKWRNFIIMQQVQLKFAAANLIYVAFVVVVVIMMLLTPLYHEIQLNQSPHVQQFLSGFFLKMIDRFALVVIVVGILAFFHQIVMTHKVCGPLVNFRHTFQKVSAKDLTRRVYLRRHDFLKEDARQINVMVDALAQELHQLRRQNQKAQKALETASADDCGLNDLRKALKLARSEVERSHERLQAFRLPDTQDIQAGRLQGKGQVAASGQRKSSGVPLALPSEEKS